MVWDIDKVKTYKLGDNQVIGRVVSEERMNALDKAAPKSLRDNGLGDIEFLLDMKLIKQIVE